MRLTIWIVIAAVIAIGAVAFFWNYGRTDRTHFDPVMSWVDGGVDAG